MAEIIDDIAYLTQEIGPHPAGTEEEQRAALYLADQMQKEAGFATVVEDFQCVTNDQLPNIIRCCFAWCCSFYRCSISGHTLVASHCRCGGFVWHGDYGTPSSFAFV